MQLFFYILELIVMIFVGVCLFKTISYNRDKKEPWFVNGLELSSILYIAIAVGLTIYQIIELF